ncbi:MAG: NAD(P)-dependent oxidoreductase [Clostridiales bacterium]|nr:NAD(P)-dependent oxidoreductase [Clostridiales bacterium]
MLNYEWSVKMENIKENAEYCLNCKVKPCQKGCPLENDIPEFIKNVKEGNYEKAYQVLCKTTVLQSICGRICPHYSQCMGKCVRGIKSHPVSIGELEYFVGDLALKNKYSMDENICEKNNKKIAIIGSGPSGLTCAAFLARSGYNVTIYEKYKKLGGILRHGIPEFRLSKDILDDVIDKILSLGINVEYEKELGVNLDLKELSKNYDAVFIAIGANIPWNMGIEGEEFKGVFGGNTLLERKEHPDYKGKNVAIIGGGNVAMDCARTINKMGANKVTVIYRRAEEQMPAEKKEIEDAKKEGIEFLFQTNIVKVIGDNENNVSKIECIKTELVKKEGESRLVPIDIENSNYELDMDYVVMAIGSTVEKNIIDKLGIECDKNGYIIVNENYETSIKNVFAGGDVIKNKATVAWAARNGRDVAKYIINKY